MLLYILTQIQKNVNNGIGGKKDLFFSLFVHDATIRLSIKSISLKMEKKALILTLTPRQISFIMITALFYVLFVCFYDIPTRAKRL